MDILKIGSEYEFSYYPHSRFTAAVKAIDSGFVTVEISEDSNKHEVTGALAGEVLTLREALIISATLVPGESEDQ